MGERPYRPRDEKNWETKFCLTCNCRERVIVRGKCIMCGNDPTMEPEVEQPTHQVNVTDFVTVRSSGKWARVDYVIAVGLVIGTLYVLWQVSRWPV